MAKVFLTFPGVFLLLTFGINYVLAAAHAGGLHTRFLHALSKRFEWEPDLTSCPNECAVFAQAVQTCRSSECYCTDSVASAYRECMVCSIDLTQNPSLLSDAQENLQEYEVNCQSDGFSVASLTVAVTAATAQPTPNPSDFPPEFPSIAHLGTSTVFASPVATASIAQQASCVYATSWATSDNSFFFGASASCGYGPASSPSSSGVSLQLSAASLSAPTGTTLVVPPSLASGSGSSTVSPSVTDVADTDPQETNINPQTTNGAMTITGASLPRVFFTCLLVVVVGTSQL
ncbi:hypothetical protein PHLCEN_2v9707 [Hermanssonia centrifuga]|uniref:Uncharacterized protein n=1 Tax=Hermanssonia centrifuga TaxID=98765 RepID=A0A2R6NPT2_9APHY|nr:hypothetical protein PHLCEN_2v9707 [Hermanssonia centrifuga]